MRLLPLLLCLTAGWSAVSAAVSPDAVLALAGQRVDRLAPGDYPGLTEVLPVYRQALERIAASPDAATAVAAETLAALWSRVAAGTLEATALYSPMFCFGICNTQEMGTEVLFEVWVQDASRPRARIFAGTALDAFPLFHALDLQPWSGRRITLELRTHPGENIRGDRAQWWEPAIAAGDPARLCMARLPRRQVVDDLVERLGKAETFMELYGERRPLGRGALWGQENHRINAYPPTRGCVGWTVGRFEIHVPATGGLAYPLTLLTLPEADVARAFPR